MIAFVIALLLFLAGAGSYALFNQDVTDVRWWYWHWYGVPDWGPLAAAVAALTVLLVFQMAYSAAIVNRTRLARKMAAHDAAIDDLRRRNLALQEELARLGGEEAVGARREMA